MKELIFFIIFIISFGGALFILVRKIPILRTLPRNGATGFKKHYYILEFENKIRNIFIFFENQIILHKLLSYIKVFTLKIETRVDHLLHNIRKNAQQNNKK